MSAPATQTRVHGTAVAFGKAALLLRGPSGAGKSDLALRLLGVDTVALTRLGISVQPRLVADDQVTITIDDAVLIASAPEPIRGLIEVRGVGIVRVPFVERAELRLVIDLVPAKDVPRMPPAQATTEVLGQHLPLLRLHAFDASAPLKCALALLGGGDAAPRS